MPLEYPVETVCGETVQMLEAMVASRQSPLLVLPCSPAPERWRKPRRWQSVACGLWPGRSARCVPPRVGAREFSHAEAEVARTYAGYTVQEMSRERGDLRSTIHRRQFLAS